MHKNVIIEVYIVASDFETILLDAIVWVCD